jgi:protoporphyrinogen oxidase
MKKVVILGAGLSGLGCALRLPGAQVFEAEDHPGGLAYSHCFDGIWYDRGAHISHSRDLAWIELISREAGEVVEICPSRVSNYWHGHWVTYPVQNHLSELPEHVRKLALDGFLAAQEKYRGAVPRNYREWCLFQYGEYLVDHFYAEYTRKYWRVPMEELATDWLSGRLLPADVQRVMKGAASSQEDNQAVFAAFRYPARGGFFAFVKPLYDRVPVRYGHRACKVDARRREVIFENGARESYEALASSIPLPELVAMIEAHPPLCSLRPRSFGRCRRSASIWLSRGQNWFRIIGFMFLTTTWSLPVSP